MMEHHGIKMCNLLEKRENMNLSMVSCELHRALKQHGIICEVNTFGIL